MHVNMTITVNETEARKLWERFGDEDASPPIDRELADWISNFCATTIQSNFQFDAGVDPIVEAEGHTETLELVKELLALDDIIDRHCDDNSPAVNTAKERRDEIKTALVIADDPEGSEDELEELLTAYAPIINGVQPGDESNAR